MKPSHEITIPAWHGTDRGTFAAFDLAHVAPFNLGLHFGTREAAQSRIDYLRTQDPSGDFRLLRCSLSIRNPFRIDDVFGHSYAGIFSALESALASLPPSDPRQRTFERLQSRWIAADDNPRFARDPSLYDAFNRRLNVSLRNLFRSLGYDGLVYSNEIESPSDCSTCESSIAHFQIARRCRAICHRGHREQDLRFSLPALSSGQGAAPSRTRPCDRGDLSCKFAACNFPQAEEIVQASLTDSHFWTKPRLEM